LQVRKDGGDPKDTLELKQKAKELKQKAKELRAELDRVAKERDRLDDMRARAEQCRQGKRDDDEDGEDIIYISDEDERDQESTNEREKEQEVSEEEEEEGEEVGGGEGGDEEESSKEAQRGKAKVSKALSSKKSGEGPPLPTGVRVLKMSKILLKNEGSGRVCWEGAGGGAAMRGGTRGNRLAPPSIT